MSARPRPAAPSPTASPRPVIPLGDRMPPQNFEAERQLLGAILLDNSIVPRIRSIVRPESFYREGHRILYAEMLGLADVGRPIDLATLPEAILARQERTGRTEAGTTADDIIELREAAPHAANAVYHAEIVAEHDRRRRAIEAFQEAVGRLYRGEATAEEIAREGFAGFAGIQEGASPKFSGPPRRIVATLRPVPSIPPSIIPVPLRAWIRDVAERMGCPLEYPAATVIVTMGAIVGRKVGIHPKRRDTWVEVPNLWGAIVGRPGMLKTPAMQDVKRPLDRLTKEALEAAREALTQWTREAMVIQAERKAAKDHLDRAAKGGKGRPAADRAELMRLAEAAEAGGVPDEPQPRRYQTNDPGIEKLADVMRVNHAAGHANSLLLFRDELSAFLCTLDKQGHESDRGFYNEAWNGKTSYTWDRIGRGTGHVPACCVSILGGIQPGPLATIVRRSATGTDDDGMLQRFQILVYPDAPAEFVNIDRWPDTKAKDRAHRVMQALNDFDAASVGASIEGKFPDPDAVPCLHFADDAQSLFDEWRTDLEHKLRSDESPALESHLAKYRKLMPALALLFHLVDILDPDASAPAGAVSLAATERAAAWCDILEAHARRVYDLALGGDPQPARTLANRLAEGKLPAEGRPYFTVREVVKKGWAGLDTPDAAERALGLLEDHDWVAAVEVPPTARGGRPTTHYYPNPAIGGRGGER